MNRSADREEVVVSPEQIEQHFGPVCEWHIVDQFETFDEASQCVQELLQAGHHARHSSIEGRCVVARRGVASSL